MKLNLTNANFTQKLVRYVNILKDKLGKIISNVNANEKEIIASSKNKTITPLVQSKTLIVFVEVISKVITILKTKTIVINF